MDLRISFFEDSQFRNFLPLTLTRPVFDLRVGIETLGQKWLREFNTTAQPSGFLRKEHEGVFKSAAPAHEGETILWINPRFLPAPSLIKKIKNLKADETLVYYGSKVAASVSVNVHNSWIENGPDFDQTTLIETKSSDIRELSRVWHLFQKNGGEIGFDIERMDELQTVNPGQFPHVVFSKPEQVFIEGGVTLEPGVVIIADDGPVYIGKNATIMANSVVRGPAAICEDSVVKMGAKIYGETTIGPVCKVGGEVQNCIFHSYSNKGHDGFTGNSLFGQWCNLGADTNTSNLKNNYGTIRLTDWVSGEAIETDQQFIGTIMGDHSKTGINAMLNTGTICGVSCNLFSADYPEKLIPSFSWVGTEKTETYQFDKSLIVMERMMKRRDVKLTPAYKRMMTAIYKKEQ